MMKKVIKVILCVVLFTISIGGLTACNSSNLNEEIRTITVENFNYDEYLATLDECSISKSQESVVIDAVKTFDKSILEGVNNVAYGEVNDFESKAEYSIRYEVENNLIFLDCVLTSDNGQAVVDTLVGTTFYTERNEIDAKKLAVASTVTAVLATTYKGDKAIFRWSNKTYTALTPRPNKPTELGVSFSYDCSAFESISALLVSSEGLVNSTGILKAVNDHGNHVDVRPNGYSIEEWKASRANASTNPHPCTVALYNVCTKVLW